MLEKHVHDGCMSQAMCRAIVKNPRRAYERMVRICARNEKKPTTKRHPDSGYRKVFEGERDFSILWFISLVPFTNQEARETDDYKIHEYRLPPSNRYSKCLELLSSSGYPNDYESYLH